MASVSDPAALRSVTRYALSAPHINASRKMRIAKGSGTSVEDVNKLLKQFENVRKMMKQLTAPGGKRGLFGKMKLPF